MTRTLTKFVLYEHYIYNNRKQNKNGFHIVTSINFLILPVFVCWNKHVLLVIENSICIFNKIQWFMGGGGGFRIKLGQEMYSNVTL